MRPRPLGQTTPPRPGHVLWPATHVPRSAQAPSTSPDVITQADAGDVSRARRRRYASPRRKMAELDLLGSILNSMERPPAAADGETRRRAREQAARMKKLQEQEKRQKVEFRKRMEQEVSQFIQATGEPRRRFQPMTKIERSILHDVAEVAGLTSFSFGDDEDSRYVMVFKKEFAPSDEELEAYRRGEEWDPARAEERRRLRELAAQQEEAELESGPAPPGPPNDYKDKYRHLIGCEAAKAAARTMEANKAYGCVPVANKRDTRSIEEAMNEIRAKKRLRQAEDEGGAGGGTGGPCV
ncbi:sperm-associated antigen 7 [Zonotrichia leucophrys gambelii]|uniref:sperm-associated antigen 7 n=1 Tax=Zonotrichia leucophrys gambelii TaxID=257770 RepID=UPI0031400029